MSAATKALKLGAPAGTLIAVLVALTGRHPVGLSGQQIGQYIAAIFFGITAVVHAPTVKRGVGKVRKGIHRPPKKRRHHPPRPTGFVTVWDTVTLGAIGRLASNSTDAVMAYDDGLYADVSEVQRDYPNHKHYTIAVHAQDDGDFLDIENGDASPQEAPDWVRRQSQRLGVAAVVTVKWVADWTGHPHVPSGFEGCQFTDHARNRQGVLGNLDESLFYADALVGPIIGLYANASTWPAVFQALKAAGIRWK